MTQGNTFKSHLPLDSSKELFAPKQLNQGLIFHFPGAGSGREINFFSDSHLAPKFLKVVANAKKVGRHFQRQTKSFFALSAF